ncbi:MAG: SGNH/GDSL hydrolase family protein [Candidatus Hydrogenedentes bacterium]|nr:SGNH/GDSL hydrolase family protein [Candidatus Hydrogenedentota bacterium]
MLRNKRKYLVALGATILALLGAEFVARAVLSTPVSPGPLVPDPELLFRLVPDSDWTWSMPQSDGPPRVVPFHVSSQGLRDRTYGDKTEGTFRILCIGDSFTMGHGLEDEKDTYPKQLEALLNARSKFGRVEAINAGVIAWGVWQSGAWLQREGLAFEPDFIVLQTYAGNDVRDSLTRVGEYLDCDEAGYVNQMRQFRYENRPAIRLDRRLRNLSYLYAAISRAVLRGPAADTIHFDCGRRFSYEVMLKESYPSLEKAWKLFEEDVADVAAWCTNHDVPYVVFNVPGPYDISDAIFEELLDGADPDLYERGKGTRRVEEAFTRREISWLPLREVFLSAPDRDALFIPMDGHLSVEGCRLLAEEVAAYVAGQDSLLP